MKHLRLSAAIGLAFLMASPAWARPGGKQGKGVMNPKRIERIATKLGVDDSVKEQMKSAVVTAKQKSIELKSQIKTHRVILRQLMASDATNRTEVMNEIDTLGALQVEMRKLRVSTMLDIRALLTPEQRVQMKRLLKKRGRKGKRGKRGWRGKRRSDTASPEAFENGLDFEGGQP